MKMLVPTLCVVLFSTLQLAQGMCSCDKKLAKAFEAKRNLRPSDIEYFSGNKYWAISVSEDSDDNVCSTEICFDKVCDDTKSVDVVYKFRNSKGTVLETESDTFLQKETYVLVKGSSVAIDFFQCSKNLIAGYQCLLKGEKESGPQYIILASMDKCLDDLEEELEKCKCAISEIDSEVTFKDRSQP